MPRRRSRGRASRVRRRPDASVRSLIVVLLIPALVLAPDARVSALRLSQAQGAPAGVNAPPANSIVNDLTGANTPPAVSIVDDLIDPCPGIDVQPRETIVVPDTQALQSAEMPPVPPTSPTAGVAAAPGATSAAQNAPLTANIPLPLSLNGLHMTVPPGVDPNQYIGQLVTNRAIDQKLAARVAIRIAGPMVDEHGNGLSIGAAEGLLMLHMYVSNRLDQALDATQHYPLPNGTVVSLTNVTLPQQQAVIARLQQQAAVIAQKYVTFEALKARVDARPGGESALAHNYAQLQKNPPGPSSGIAGADPNEYAQRSQDFALYGQYLAAESDYYQALNANPILGVQLSKPNTSVTAAIGERESGGEYLFQALSTNADNSTEQRARFIEGLNIYLGELQSAKTQIEGMKTAADFVVLGGPQYAQAQSALRSLGISHVDSIVTAAQAAFDASNTEAVYKGQRNDAVIAILSPLPGLGQGLMLFQIVRAGNGYAIAIASEQRAKALAPLLGFRQASEASMAAGSALSNFEFTAIVNGVTMGGANALEALRAGKTVSLVVQEQRVSAALAGDTRILGGAAAAADAAAAPSGLNLTQIADEFGKDVANGIEAGQKLGIPNARLQQALDGAHVGDSLAGKTVPELERNNPTALAYVEAVALDRKNIANLADVQATLEAAKNAGVSQATLDAIVAQAEKTGTIEGWTSGLSKDLQIARLNEAGSIVLITDTELQQLSEWKNSVTPDNIISTGDIEVVEIYGGPGVIRRGTGQLVVGNGFYSTEMATLENLNGQMLLFASGKQTGTVSAADWLAIRQTVNTAKSVGKSNLTRFVHFDSDEGAFHQIFGPDFVDNLTGFLQSEATAGNTEAAQLLADLNNADLPIFPATPNASTASAPNASPGSGGSPISGAGGNANPDADTVNAGHATERVQVPNTFSNPNAPGPNGTQILSVPEVPNTPTGTTGTVRLQPGANPNAGLNARTGAAMNQQGVRIISSNLDPNQIQMQAPAPLSPLARRLAAASQKPGIVASAPPTAPSGPNTQQFPPALANNPKGTAGTSASSRATVSPGVINAGGGASASSSRNQNDANPPISGAQKSELLQELWDLTNWNDPGPIPPPPPPDPNNLPGWMKQDEGANPGPNPKQNPQQNPRQQKQDQNPQDQNEHGMVPMIPAQGAQQLASYRVGSSGGRYSYWRKVSCPDHYTVNLEDIYDPISNQEFARETIYRGTGSGLKLAWIGESRTLFQTPAPHTLGVRSNFIYDFTNGSWNPTSDYVGDRNTFVLTGLPPAPARPLSCQGTTQALLDANCTLRGSSLTLWPTRTESADTGSAGSNLKLVVDPGPQDYVATDPLDCVHCSFDWPDPMRPSDDPTILGATGSPASPAFLASGHAATLSQPALFRPVALRSAPLFTASLFQQLALAQIAPAAPMTGKPARIVYSLVANGKSTGESFLVQALDPSGAIKAVHLPEGTVLEPLVQGVARPLSAPDPRNIVAQAQNAFCVDFHKAPPAPGTLYRIAAESTQRKFQSIRYIAPATRKLYGASKLHGPGNLKDYGPAAAQYAYWSLIEGWSRDQFIENIVERTKRNAEAAGAKWTPQMESGMRSAMPVIWGDVSEILAEADFLKQLADTAMQARTQRQQAVSALKQQFLR